MPIGSPNTAGRASGPSPFTPCDSAADLLTAPVLDTLRTGLNDLLSEKSQDFTLIVRGGPAAAPQQILLRATRLEAEHSDASVQKPGAAERLLFRTQLIQSQKLEALGTLAGGVAHEINNPINGVMNYAQLMLDQMTPANPLREYASEIMREVDRIALIVRNLLAFARNDKQTHRLAALADIAEATLSLVKTVIRQDQITLFTVIPPDLPRLKCRSQQIQQVIMNLVTNARDALNARYPGYDPDKKILITARKIVPPAEKRVDGASWIRMTVEDHGAGIRPDIRDRVFDPFFTTKPRDQGTGLGLSISHSIVKDHGGELWFESEPGRFTRFHVDLPAESHAWEPVAQPVQTGDSWRTS
jgi:signal transduction histidine kinase